MLETRMWVAVLLLVGGCATPIEIPGTDDAVNGNFGNNNAPSADAHVGEKDSVAGLDDAAVAPDSGMSDYDPIQPPPGDMGPEQSANDGTTAGDGTGDGAADASGDATSDAPPADGLDDAVPDGSGDLSDLSNDLSAG